MLCLLTCERTLSAHRRIQKAIWKIGETIGDREGRMDVCVAAAGILKQDIDCLEYPADTFQEVSQLLDVN